MCTSTQMHYQTNVECVMKLMEHSRFGALSQAFIIDAIERHAEAVAKLTDEQVAHLDTNPTLFSMNAWRAVAQEIKTALELHLAGVLVPNQRFED